LKGNIESDENTYDMNCFPEWSELIQHKRSNQTKDQKRKGRRRKTATDDSKQPPPTSVVQPREREGKHLQLNSNNITYLINNEPPKQHLAAHNRHRPLIVDIDNCSIFDSCGSFGEGVLNYFSCGSVRFDGAVAAFVWLVLRNLLYLNHWVIIVWQLFIISLSFYH
jgi:hypothetical protein